MSYARFEQGVSDVYVYGKVETVGEKIECCGCKLEEKRFFVGDASDMLKHLEEHRAAGHLVPEYAMERLRSEVA